MEPGGRPSLGQVSSCQCIMVAVRWSSLVGPCAVCFPSRRTCHWPCQWRVLVVCYYYKRDVALGALCELAKHKMGPAFSHFVVSEGAFLSSLSCTVHLRAVHMARSRPAGPRDVVCSRSLSPCSGLYAPSPDDGGARWAPSRRVPKPREISNTPPEFSRCIPMTTTWGEG